MKQNRLIIGGFIAVSLFCLTSFASPAVNAADQKEAPKTVTQKKETGFVGSSESKVYHKASCQFAKKIKPENLVKFKTREEAVKAGYLPCKKCITAEKK